MFDARLRRMINPLLEAAATGIAKTGVGANAITVVGALIGLGAGYAIAREQYLLGMLLIIANRLADGLDGPLARLHGSTEFGGYLDSLADYVFYIAVPLGFAIAAPANVWPALLLIASFTLTAVSFLALAAVLAGRDLGHGEKAFAYSTGLMEGGETIGVFLAMCLFPVHFPLLATIFAALCVVTVGQRLWLARRLLR
jgi:phosphatidylglycerophosphate synthase